MTTLAPGFPAVLPRDADADTAAQQARSKRYGIGIKDGGNVTKPAKWAGVKDSKWGDPVNYRYPMPDKAHADNAASRWGDASNRSQYTAKEQGIIGKRIKRQQAKYGSKEAKAAFDAQLDAWRADRDVAALLARAKPSDKHLDQAAVNIALNKLASMPEVAPGRVQVPFPYEPDPPFKLGAKSMHGARHTKVDLDELIALQPTVRSKRVGQLIQKDGHYSNIPLVVGVHGKRYIYAGHHRLTSDTLLGKQEARVNLLDTGEGN